MNGSRKMETNAGTTINGETFIDWFICKRRAVYNKIKNEIAVDGDLSYLNLDWTPVPILPKFVDIVVNGMQDREFKVKAFAQDALSQAKKVNTKI